MKVYKFVFVVGLSILLLPFVGIPGIYKQYLYVALGVSATLYALFIRTIEKEKENGLVTVEPIQYATTPQAYKPDTQTPQVTRKIEEVVEMEEKQDIKRPRVKAKRPTIKAQRVIVEEDYD